MIISEPAPSRPFRAAAEKYRASGFLGTLPLPPGEKNPPPAGFTGSGRPQPDDERVAAWLAGDDPERPWSPGANIALRLAEVPHEVTNKRDDLPFMYAGNNVDGWELLGIDVDDYTKGDGPPKRGAAELQELEAEHGPLPPTAISSSRWSDHPQSGIRVFLVPKGYRYMGKAAPSIDVVQKRHRFMVAAPSTNPDNAGARYEWRHGTAEGTTPLNDYPDVGDPNDVASLPEAWFKYLSRGGQAETNDPISDLTDDELMEWLGARPAFDAEPCRIMQAAIDKWAAQIEFSTSSHDVLRDAHWRVLNLAAEGHAGLHAALKAVGGAGWADALAKRDSPETLSSEMGRSVVGALSKIEPGYAGRGWPEDTCAVDLSRFDCDGWAARLRADEQPEDAPSWALVNIGAARRGVGATPPTILQRSDGACLFYRGKTHSVHGESESGKSWLVQCAAAECLLAGETVLYIDFEDDGGPVGERLILLGVPAEVVDDSTRFAYVHPESPPTTDYERGAFEALLSRNYALAVVDGVTDSMAVFGLSTKDNDDVAQWQRTLPKAIARRTGAAVVCVDHVTKDTQTRNRFALGGQHKMAGLSGAAYLVEMEQPFAVGQAGRASVRVGKDRPGMVRGLGGRWRKGDRTQHVADLFLDSTGANRAEWSLATPSNAGSATEVESGKPAQGKGGFRPTWFMEQISRYWEETDDPEERTNNKTVAAMCRERKEQGKTQHRDHWRRAVKVLVDEGFAKTEPGARESEIHVVIRPYRQIEDPLCDEYSDAGAVGLHNWRHKLSDAEADEAGAES